MADVVVVEGVVEDVVFQEGLDLARGELEHMLESVHQYPPISGFGWDLADCHSCFCPDLERTGDQLKKNSTSLQGQSHLQEIQTYHSQYRGLMQSGFSSLRRVRMLLLLKRKILLMRRSGGCNSRRVS